MNINLRRLTFMLGILFLGISIFINSPAPVQAATIQVDIDTDNNLATLDQVGNGPCSLREAINNAINDAALSDDCPAGAGDDIITFSSNFTIVISNNVSAGVISVNTNITINGDVTLDGNNLNNIFVMSGTGDIVLDNITFINGNNSAGGAILVNSPTTNLTITDSDFDGNNADGNGGAISSSGQLSIFNTIFQNNTADVEGGAIHHTASSPMTIMTTGFLNNTAGTDNNGRGGAIYHSEGSLLVSTITASYFDDNTADNADSADGGGAIYHNGGQLLITASAFSGNTADGTDARGGAINNSSTDSFALEINYSHFGETLSFPLPLPAPLNVLSLTDGNTVTGTTANTSGGGAIYSFGPMEITAVSFIGNTSSSHGGAIFNQASTDDDGIFDGDEVIIANTTFYDNTATGDGGAFYNEFGAEDDLVSFQNVTIADNTAVNGDGIFNEGDGESPDVSNFDDISIVNSIIANNDCAGGELGNGNLNPSGNNVVFNSTCTILQQVGMTVASPITTDPILLAPSLEFSLGALVTFTMEIDAGSSASGTGDAASCSAFPVINLDQRGLPLGTRPQGDPICDIGAYESDQVAPAPEIDVQGLGVSIVDGDTTPDVLDDTDFGITTIGTPVTNTFTIANTGTANLTITTPLGNSDAVNFTLTNPSGTVTAGGNTTFDVTCNALSINTFTATITITNNDADENPYTFDVTCQVDGVPEIDVLGLAVSIVDGDNSPSVTDDTDFGSTTVGTPVTHTFTVENTGSADLTLSTPTLTDAVNFSVTVLASPVGAGGSTTFDITCNALSAATFTATVSITNNDSNENPYTFDVTCNVTAAPEPEMDVLGNAVSIVDGDNTPSVTDDTDFGSTTVGTPITNTFTVANTGTADLTLSTPTLTDAVNFSVTVLASPVGAGGSTTFDITCNALSVAAFTTTVSITNNDSNENPYTFDVTCNVTAAPEPEMDVQGNAVSIADGDNSPSVTDDTDFGSTTVGTPITNTFTVANTGTADLTLSNPILSDPVNFTVTGLPSPVGAGASTTFDITCNALSVNTFTTTVSITNNDADENPYTFDVTCDVTALDPEIDILGNAVTIVDGDNTPSVADDTDFGSTPIGTPVTNTFTLENTGTADLTLSNPILSDPVNFTVTGLPSPVGAGASTTFDITCNALSVNTFTTTVSITNNDADENPYTFDVTCDVTALEPEMDVLGNAVSIADGDNSPSVTDDTDFGTTPIGTPITNTFTVANTGNTDLTLLTPVLTDPVNFSVTVLASPVGAGASTTFDITCNALSVATFTATVSITNNDADENPYTFDVTCDVTALEPEMDVLGNAVSIADGDNSPSGTDDTDFSTTPIGTPITNTFTVANTGNTDLTLLTPVLTDPVNFSVTVLASPVGAGASTTFDITCNALSVATFTATVSITNNDADENPYTFDVTCNVVAATADLAVTKTDSPDPVADGANITYTITITNNGAVAAANVDLTDNIPANTTFVSFTAPAGFSSTTPAVGGTGTVTSSAATLAAGATANFTLVVNVNAGTAAGTIINNTATAATTTTDPIPANDFATASTTVAVATADLAVTKTDSPDPVADGANITYTITVTNNGTIDAANVDLTDTIPANTTFVSFTAPAGFSSTTPAVGGTGTVTSSAATLAAGATANFTLIVNVNAGTAAGTIINNTATAATTTTDPIPANDFATASTTVAAATADLAVTKTDSPDPVADGANITYTITVTNNGTIDAANVDLTDTIPANTTFVSFTAPAGFSSTTPAVGGTGTVTSSAATLAAGATANFTLVVNVNAGTAAGTIINNTATAATTTTDSNPANDSATAATTVAVAGTTDLTVTKTDSPDPVVDGTNITYTITLTNNGVSDAANVDLTDTIPANTTFVSFTAPAGFSSTTPAVGGTGTITSSAATVVVGANLTFTLVVNVNAGTAAGTIISNTATAATTTTDPVPGNDSATATTTVAVAGTPSYTSAPFAPAATINFGGVLVGNFADLTLIISENGTADLDINSVSITGAGFSIQSVTPAVPFTIVDNSGNMVVVVLRCTPSAAGAITGTLTVTHNATGQTVDYPLTCNGTTGSTTGGGGGSTTGSSTAINVFDPAISKIGFLLPGQVGVTGETLEWVVTVSNVSAVAGTNVTITDTLIPELQILRVEAPGGTVTISGQTVTVVYPTLAVGQTVTFSIFTLVTDGLDVSNTACVVTPNECATASLVSELPSTGENPWWYWPLLGLIVGLVGMSIISLRRVLRKA